MYLPWKVPVSSTYVGDRIEIYTRYRFVRGENMPLLVDTSPPDNFTGPNWASLMIRKTAYPSVG